MINVNVIQYPGLESIKDNFEFYKNLFLSDAVIAFRGAHCDREEQQEVMQLFGDAFGWWPNSERPGSISNYEETHERHMDSDNTADKDSLMLGWHLEHVQLQRDIYVGSSWCMNLFRCDPDAGKTFFVDMLSLYENLPEDYKGFISSVEVLLTSYWGSHDKPDNLPPATYKLVQPHWILGKNVLRVFLGSRKDVKLHKVAGGDPTELDVVKFDEILNYIYDQVSSNTDIRMVHSWHEGDMVISDMFRMAHAVTGGFDKGQRRLDGIFGRLIDN